MIVSWLCIGQLTCFLPSNKVYPHTSENDFELPKAGWATGAHEQLPGFFSYEMPMRDEFVQDIFVPDAGDSLPQLAARCWSRCRPYHCPTIGPQ